MVTRLPVIDDDGEVDDLSTALPVLEHLDDFGIDGIEIVADPDQTPQSPWLPRRLALLVGYQSDHGLAVLGDDNLITLHSRLDE